MWLKQPLLNVNDINSRLDVVQAFVEDTVLRQDLRQHLKRISDIERLVHNLQKRKAGLQHVVKLYQVEFYLYSLLVFNGKCRILPLLQLSYIVVVVAL
jgi:DNA mismatch repair ATPase MutS